jgi:HAD superfamily hydrolase (TIGR01458 family)
MLKAVLFDLDGVLYEGDRPVPGAAEAVRWFRQQGIPHLFLTNTTSRPRQALVEKLAGMQIEVTADDLFTPPVAARQWLVDQDCKNIALFVPEATREEFSGLPLSAGKRADAVVLGDLGEAWDFATLNRAFRLLMENDASLVALGMTRYWRAPDGLRLDVGPFVRALEYATGKEAVVLGKPARPFFEAALAILGTRPEETLMIGDDIRGDVAAAQAAGLRAALVRTGKFLPGDLEQQIRPDAVLDSVAQLPQWWRQAGLRSSMEDPG